MPPTSPEDGNKDNDTQELGLVHTLYNGSQDQSADQSTQSSTTPAPPSDGSSRVRFSIEIQRAHDGAVQPKVPGSSEQKPQGILKSPSYGRDRGYSLRRALFAQNIQKQRPHDEGAFELDPARPSSSQQYGAASEKTESETQSTTVTVEETGEPDFPARPLRLSDPALELPLYQRWLSKQHSRSTVLRKLRQNYLRFRDKLARSNTIPPSIDGRHVKVNVLPAAEPIDERTGKPYIKNAIRSCRYTPWNFVPRQLVAQFGKLANFYFLCVSILQMIPGLSTTGTYTTIIPLLVFVAISMAKEGYDDVRRHRLDKEENARLAMVLRADPSQPDQSDLHWHEQKWSDIQVGDVVLLERDAGVPADLVLLHADEPTGTAYVETKSLDGETNLKPKKPVSDVSAACRSPESIAELEADFVVEDPNLDLYNLDGRVSLNAKTLPLTSTEVLYRGSVLRNTPSAIGLVIYSGEECKIRMNANKTPRVKAPALQAKVNRIVVLVASLVFFIAIILTAAYQIWRRTTEDKSWYLESARVPFGHILTSFIIMLNTMLPLSLYVSLEIIKLAQMFLMNDIDMYDPESDTPMEPHTSTINEELGQVSYIFSDKTGTLTNNSMKFRKLSVAGTAWLHDLDLQEEAEDEADQLKLKHKKRGGKEKHIPPVKQRRQSASRLVRKSTQSEYSASPDEGGERIPPPLTDRRGLSLETGKTQDLLDYIYRRPQTIFARKVRFFLLSLALCHTCIPEKDEDGNIAYQAASPDEMALVTGAQELGYIVTNRQSNTVTIKTFPDGDEHNPIYEIYEVMDVIEFSSARKRMSIIVRFPDHRICLITKGADSTVRNLLRLADLASSKVQAAESRASQRKSLEVQEILRRKSTQLSRKSESICGLDAISPRVSSVSIDRSRATRDSIDHWLKEREHDAGMSSQRNSFQFYAPRPSAQFGPCRSGTPGRSSQQSAHSTPRASMQADEEDELVEESLVVNDNAVFERCFQHIDDFATEGLRTLLYGYRFLSEQEYKTWKSVYISATTSLVDRQGKIERAAELVEDNLELLGATAIEDKLQKGVPDAIDRFRRAGIKMWMLTGDKRETAINIGHSCRLIKDYSTVIVLDHELGDLHGRMASAFAQIDNETTAHSVLVVDGQTLTIIDADQASRALFTDVAIRADSVICCRASPSQKASLVKTIRTKVKGSVTLAIGDGANDIAMIQEAHVGIGIAGKEGLQAARTSDYSIAQFRFLLKLLLVHGRWNYVRICKYTLGTFWKEMFFYLIQAIYQRWNGYTGTSLYESWSLSMFNTLFTSLPVIFMGVFEKDLAASTLLAVPELYNIGQRNRGFNFKLYLRWATLGACEAVIVYFIMYGIYGQAPFARDQGLYAMGSLAFSGCIVIISLKLQLIELHNKSVAAAIAIFLSVGGWWLWNIFLSCVYPDDVVYSVKHGLLERFGRSLLWWITLLLIIVSVCVLEIMLKAIGTVLWPTDVDIFQGFEQDREVRKRFEEAAADLLQQGWDRGTKKSSIELAREAAEQAQREAQVQELLDRRWNLFDQRPWVKRTQSGLSTGNISRGTKVHETEVSRDMEENVGEKSTDIGELFSKGFGAVRNGPDLR